MQSFPCAHPTTGFKALLIGILTALSANATGSQDAAPFKKPGFYTDNFHILPEVEATAYRDDNIYATKTDRESDRVGLISPSLRVKSRWERHSLDLGAGANLARYADHATEDYDDYWLSGEGELDLTAATRLYASAGFSSNHESRDSKEGGSQQTEELTTYDVSSSQLGVNRRFGRSSIRLGLTYDALDYDNVGALYNDDRDRRVYGLGVRLAHALSQETQIYAQGVANQRDYEERRDQFGYAKDSEGYSLAAGLSRDFSGGHKIDVYLGQLYQDYDERRFARVNELNYGLDLRWLPWRRTQLTGKVDRTLNETTETGSSGYLYTAVDLQMEQKLATDFLGYINYNRGLAEFQDVGREDLTRSLSLGLKYYASPWIMISASYSHIDNDSNDQNSVAALVDSYDYERNLFFLTLRARLAP